jgi:hypothetical protein
MLASKEKNIHMKNQKKKKETHKCLHGKSSGISGLKYHREAAMLIKFASPRKRGGKK